MSSESQWDKLKAMRAQHDGEEAPKPPKKPAATPAATDADDDDAADDAGDDAEHEPTAVELEQQRLEEEAKATAGAGTPGTVVEPPTAVEIEIDGQKIHVAPDIAAAFQKAEGVLKPPALDAVADRERLKAELKQELAAEFTPLPKTAAELEAARAIAEAAAAATAPKKPDPSLMVSDPEEYERQRDVYEDWRIKHALQRDREARETTSRADQARLAAEQEEQARGILREQFFAAYPVLKSSELLVKPLMDAKLEEVKRSGKLSKPLTPAEREALKTQAFAEVAASATREVVKVMQAGRTVLPPPPAPPALASGQPAKSTKKKTPAEPPAEPRAKYPPGSVSASLAEHKRRKEGAAA